MLAPWPNRIRDGIWQDGDDERAMVITEPKLRKASHGLRYTAYDVVEHTDAEVTLAATIVPQIGCPISSTRRSRTRSRPTGSP